MTVCLRDNPILTVKKQMKIITRDGRCAGHVGECSPNQILVSKSGFPIPREWIRRVDGEVYISKRWNELPHKG